MGRYQKRIKIDNFEGVGVFDGNNTVKYNAAKRDRSKPADGTSHQATGGLLKVEFCGKLGDSWRDLADVLDVRPDQRARFERGDEARGIWEWLEARNRWSELPGALRAIGRPELADALDGGRAS